jgi:hypothetical protein
VRRDGRRHRSRARWHRRGLVTQRASDTRPQASSERNATLVVTERDVWSMAACLLSQQRVQPAVGLASGDAFAPLALSPGDVRAVVGPLPRIYLLKDERLLSVLAGLVGRSFALLAGTARIWWPGLAFASDPQAHPLVVPLVDERGQGVRGEFARAFDLSRPVVRRELAEIEDARRLAEHQLRQVRNASRQTQAPASDRPPSMSIDQHGRQPSERLGTEARSVRGRR